MAQGVRGSGRFVSHLVLLLSFAACTLRPKTAPTVEPTRIPFSSPGVASLSIPSLNGNLITVRIMKPPGDGPFPALVGVAGGNEMFVFQSSLPSRLNESGIVAVDFAPQGRGGSEGDDNYHGYVHQDDLKAVVDFVSKLPFVLPDNIGVLSYSYGIVLAAGALARHPDIPVDFLIDWEGPSCPAKDLLRGLKNGESWAQQTIRYLNHGADPTPAELSGLKLHGGTLLDAAYWDERDAARFALDLPCPYLRVQFDIDHSQGTSKAHMLRLLAAAAQDGHWTRLNDNPPNQLYSETDLSRLHFLSYLAGEAAGLTTSAYSQSVDTVLLAYAQEMFFERPFEP